MRLNAPMATKINCSGNPSGGADPQTTNNRQMTPRREKSGKSRKSPEKKEKNK
jgi:hypothetical protein